MMEETRRRIVFVGIESVDPETLSKYGKAHTMQMAIISQMKRFYSLKRALTSCRRHRGWRVKYRLGGNLLVRKWIKENAEYIESLKQEPAPLIGPLIPAPNDV